MRWFLSFLSLEKASLVAMLVCAAFGTPSFSASADWCEPDLSAFVRLETLAKQEDSSGVMARSAISYLVEKKISASGYFISRKPRAEAGNNIEFSLYHESGFSKPCVVGNRSGLDGVLTVDKQTHEVKRFLFWQ